MKLDFLSQSYSKLDIWSQGLIVNDDPSHFTWENNTFAS
jgi:hypothetical protein